MYRVLVIIILISISCNKKKDEISFSNCHYGYFLDLKEKIICNGDTVVYNELLNIYSDDWNKEDFLSFSIIMANKYDYPKAYFDVFETLISLPNINANICVSNNCLDNGFYCLDEKSKTLAIEYFINAVNKGDKYASKVLLNKFNKDKEYPIKEFYDNLDLVVKAKQNLKIPIPAPPR
jgi:hypothetical protein